MFDFSSSATKIDPNWTVYFISTGDECRGHIFGAVNCRKKGKDEVRGRFELAENARKESHLK